MLNLYGYFHSSACKRVRALALGIACEIQPLNNLRVLNYLAGDLGLDEAQRRRWDCRWVQTGHEANERMLASDPPTGSFAHGDFPGLADCFVVAQMCNAGRFGCRLEAFPTLLRIDAQCMALEAFRSAAPERQPDAE